MIDGPVSDRGADGGAKSPGPASPLVDVVELRKHFPVRRGLFARAVDHVRAVDGVSFSVGAGETFGLVGESGCGKTTVGRTLLRLQPATSGDVRFEGRSILGLSRAEFLPYRRRMQLVFQDPYGSLPPRMSVGEILAEPFRIHRLARGTELVDRVQGLLKSVGLRSDAAERYPHEFSGGQRQRIGVARALALEPSFIVCDEPTSALDVSIRAQIVNLLDRLQRERGLSYLMISHDLAVVRRLSRRVAVMYLGRIVEEGPARELYAAPRHPYTCVLLGAAMRPDPSRRGRRIAATDDEIPSPVRAPSGCAFHPRCPLYEKLGRPAECRERMPELAPAAGLDGREVRCHFAEKTATVLGTE